MKILKIYISKNNGQNKEIELVVNDYTTEDLAEEIARKEFLNEMFNDGGYDWELIDGNTELKQKC